MSPHEKPYLLVELPADQLLRAKRLERIDTTVQSRHENHKHARHARKDQAEIHTLVGMLRFAGHLPVPMPARVIHSDRPDFKILGADTEIGIQIVEAISQTTAAVECERGRIPNAPQLHWAIKQQPGEMKASAERVRDLVLKNNPGDGYGGDGTMAWAEAIVHFVHRKIETASKPGFEKLKQTWLLVYDNWQEHNTDPDQANRLLHGMLLDRGAFDTFQWILILTSPNLHAHEARANFTLVAPGS